jgi:hypothetical protein
MFGSLKGMTRPRKDLEIVRDLLDHGLSVAEASRRAGIPRSTVRTWLSEGLEARINAPSTLHGADELCPYVRDLTESTYAYLLGLYLGDGHLSKYPRDVYKLRVYQDNKYPFLIHQCQIAMHWIIPNKVGIVHREGCKEIYSFSKHWLCLFPQHGDGPKHKRPILLEPWQQWIAVEQHPRMLLRGLIHSDGCRALNKVWGGRYEYVRYMFSNRSEDIHRIFAMACDRAGIEWRRSYKWTTSVSKRASVKAMEQFVGAKS